MSSLEHKTNRTYLNVPFKEKEEAKKSGARWDPEVKKWYAPRGVDPEPLNRWYKTDIHANIIIAPPLYLAISTEPCYRCGWLSNVAALACKKLKGIEIGSEWLHLKGRQVLFLNHIESLPEEIIETINNFWPRYSIDFSKTLKSSVWMNHCEKCEAKLGDHYMHCESGGAFCPATQEEADKITFRSLGLSGEYYIQASYGSSSADFKI